MPFSPSPSSLVECRILKSSQLKVNCSPYPWPFDCRTASFILLVSNPCPSMIVGSLDQSLDVPHELLLFARFSFSKYIRLSLRIRFLGCDKIRENNSQGFESDRIVFISIC
uniref:Uncharacterized protein n=1 Tax=Compsopogon caeruleus TaxID=31354 RepID=A0A7S1TAY3_9RHOD